MNGRTFADIDRDGALSEALAGMVGHSRAALLRRAAVGGAALLGALAAAGDGDAAPNRNDTAILNYALVLEYMQASFYTEAERLGALRGAAAKAAGVVGPVERAHVAAFQKALGKAAVKRPAFDFRGTTEDEQQFLKTAVAFEDLAVAAYKAQAPLLQEPGVLAVAVSIHSVEARHAAWMRRLVGKLPAEKPFDEPIGKPEVLRLVAETHFISRRAETKAKRKPKYTG
jgi:Ferritin-like domain